MPFMTESRYEAIIFYLESVKKGLKTRSIDWDSPPLKVYAQQRFGEDDHDYRGFVDVSTAKLKQRRHVFITNSKAFSLGLHIGKTKLFKNEKPVPRPSEYEGILNLLHDERGHGGSKALENLVSKKLKFRQFNSSSLQLIWWPLARVG
jgi:hypothetical protein